MHPIVAYGMARSRIADFHHEAEGSRRVRAARLNDSAASPHVVAGSRWGDAADPTGLVRRLLGRLRPVVAP
jgi:hypothetical protein